MSSKIYVTQYGITWSLTPEAWKQVCEMALADKEWNWDNLGKRLSRPKGAWEKQFHPLDWDKEAWRDELKRQS